MLLGFGLPAFQKQILLELHGCLSSTDSHPLIRPSLSGTEKITLLFSLRNPFIMCPTKTKKSGHIDRTDPLKSLGLSHKQGLPLLIKQVEAKGMPPKSKLRKVAVKPPSKPGKV